MITGVIEDEAAKVILRVGDNHVVALVTHARRRLLS